MQFESMEARLETALIEIARLKIPKKIFDMDMESSGPVEGFCVEDEPCLIRVKLRRFPETVDCRIVVGASRYSWFTSRNDPLSGTRLDAQPNRNLGSDWEFYDILMQTPVGVGANVRFSFQNFYTNCPATTPDMQPLPDTSQRITIEIRKKTP